MANVIKDIGEIWTRLFDHRPFLNGEIKFFLQEFEEKRGDREVNRLFEVLQNLTEIRYTQIDKIKQEGETNLATLKKKIDDSYSVCNNILDKEGKYSIGINIDENNVARKAKLESLAQEIAGRCSKVDEVFDEEEKKLLKRFSYLDKQYHLSPGHST